MKVIFELYPKLKNCNDTADFEQKNVLYKANVRNK